jgi:hypothetical protein
MIGDRLQRCGELIQKNDNGKLGIMKKNIMQQV